ncbi:MAG: tRNA pseudouridine(38-40) synthase TruA [Bacteroidales bacterium]|nr:tRNA pseudouridine(38-40) synthase TruA [Bacteroidales bacterium]
MGRYFLHLGYKGTRYFGWQEQPGQPTVQATIEENIAVLFRQKIKITGCGRTDTGVHARNFYAHFDIDEAILAKPEVVVYKLNCLLPPDIKIINIIPVDDNAHARFDATHRQYKYYIAPKKEVFLGDYAWQLFKNLDIEKMNKAAGLLLNYSDFTSFSKLHSGAKTNICNIKNARWYAEKGLLVFDISADRFLRNMVRAIVGTLVDIGKNKIGLNDFCRIIENKDRQEAGTSVPACGLFLENVYYSYLKA